MGEGQSEEGLRALLSTYLQNGSNDADLTTLNDKALGVASTLYPDLSTTRVVNIATEIAETHKSKLRLGPRVTAEDFTPWLEDRKSLIEFRRSDAYEQLLTQKGWGRNVVRTLGKQTDHIVELMGDPQDESDWARKGLAIGEVQSGKTATYIGALNKALDLGYQIVVVIGGHTEDLRRQTQERLDSDLIGDDTSYLNETAAKMRDNRIGIGRIVPDVETNSLTSARYDFSIKTVKSTTVKLGTGNPTVFVVKKNSRVLESLAKYIRATAPGDRHTAPIAVIDDESDWASVNTSARESERTAVNRSILDLLDVSARSSYLGITATPFANILIADDQETKDLFPKDYIVALESPSNYNGVDYYFPPDGGDAANITTEIDDFHDLLPQKHKKDAYVGDLADSLKEAVLSFYIATAVRYSRNSAQSPSSMMVNVSRFNQVQATFHEIISGFVSDVNNELIASAGVLKNPDEEPSPIVSSLEIVARKQYPNLEFDIRDIGDELQMVAEDIHVDLVNGLTMKSRNEQLAEMTRVRLADWKKRPVIFVGGNILARGLTLDGLVVSYFTRRASAADTLLQMGRWFGYRPGYEDLTKVWMDREVVDHFTYVAEVSKELRSSVAEMHDLNLTPRDFGLKIRLHPDAFLITAANKQRSGVKHSHAGVFSYRGRAFETHVLPANATDNANNQAAVRQLLTGLANALPDDPVLNAESGPVYWRGVPHSLVQAFLSRFSLNRNLPMSKVFGVGGHLPEGIASIGQERGWTVGFISGQGRIPNYLNDWTRPRPEVFSTSIRNNVKLERGDHDIQLSRRRVASSGNIAAALTEAESSTAYSTRKVEEGSDPNAPLSQRDTLTYGLTSPLLLVYSVALGADTSDQDPDPDVVSGRQTLRELEAAPALVMATPTLTADEQRLDLAERGNKFGVKYIVNSVYARLELGLGDDDEDEGGVL